MTNTATVTLTAADLTAIESMLDLAGQFLADWSDTIDDNEADDVEALAEQVALYRKTCTQFGVLPLEI